MNYTNEYDRVTIGKSADTYNLLDGNDRIILSPCYIDYVNRTVDTEGWEQPTINGGDGTDTIMLGRGNIHYMAESVVKLGEVVDGWALLTNTINGNAYTALIKNIEIFRGVVDFTGNSEGNRVISVSSSSLDITLRGGEGNDNFTVRNGEDARFTQTITVSTGGGDDIVRIEEEADSITLDLDGGDGFDTLIFGDNIPAGYADCAPCSNVRLGSEDSITGFENFVFSNNVNQRVFISNEFLSNMQSDSLTIEGGNRTQVFFTDDLELLDFELDANCKDGYLHYQLELVPDTSSVTVASSNAGPEAPKMMDIYVEADIWMP